MRFDDDNLFSRRCVQGFEQLLMHFITRNVQSKSAILSDTDAAGFLADHDDETVGLKGDADARAVARAEFGRNEAIFGEGELDIGRGDAIASDDNTEVVKGIVGPEDGLKEAGGEIRVEENAAFDKSAEADVSFYGDECTNWLLLRNSTASATSSATRRVRELVRPKNRAWPSRTMA